jgi:hypothetical protein
LRLEVLRCFHEIDEIDVAVYESIELNSSAGPRRAPKRVYKIREGVGIRKGDGRSPIRLWSWLGALS